MVHVDAIRLGRGMPKNFLGIEPGLCCNDFRAGNIRRSNSSQPSIHKGLMKRQIIAYLYPKLEELDAYLRQHDFDARRHISPDSTEAHVPSMNDGMARAIEEVFGLPQGALDIVDAGSTGPTGPSSPVERGTSIHQHIERLTADLNRSSKLRKRLLALGVVNPDRYIPDNPHEFVWVSHNGSRRRISEMASPHIFYSLRMIFNHSVPPAFRVLRPGETMNRYSDVPHWTPAYRQAAVNAFTRELCSRDDLEPELQAQFDDMKANTQLILALGL